MIHTDFSRSNALYKRALRTVPSASQTLSKSASSFVRGASPLFLERGEGCHVWDVDGNRYIDFVLGLLPVVLGYRDPDVDAAIRKQLERGITFSLSTELEVELAEILVDLIPCAEMVRFGKNGSDVTSAAIRLARAHTGRDRVAVCGYHGWHDWYIGTTTRNLGVPETVRKLSAAFAFNDLDSLDRLLGRTPDKFAAIILEPESVDLPAPGFLEGVRALADRHSAVLIFDEIVSGFRSHIGGAQERYGVVPDLATFGKAMGNGMPISAIVGRTAIMRTMDEIFFSGTFGGETLSLAAALATIRKLEREDAVQCNQQIGRWLAESLRDGLERHGLSMRYKVKGPDWRPIVSTLAHDYPANLATSLLRQELVANGLLMGSGVNICFAHGAPHVVEEAARAFDKAFAAIASAFESNDPMAHLRGAQVQPIFQVRKE